MGPTSGSSPGRPRPATYAGDSSAPTPVRGTSPGLKGCSSPWTGTPPGGDASSGASASLGGIGSYAWESSNQLVTDVQNWLDDPAANFGWLLLGDESKSQTTKRFDSKDHETEANRPVLTGEYTR